MPGSESGTGGRRITLQVTTELRRDYRRRMLWCRLRAAVWSLVVVGLVLVLGVLITVLGGPVGLVLVVAGLVLLGLQLRRVDAGARSLSRIVDRDEVVAELGPDAVRILRPGVPVFSLLYCEVVGPLRRDVVTVTFQHVVDGHGHWPAGLITPEAQQFVESHAGPRDVAALVAAEDAHDVVVGEVERDELVAALRRHQVLFTWRRWLPISAMLVVVGLVVQSWPVVVFGVAFLLLSPLRGFGRSTRRTEAVYPLGTTVRLQVADQRLAVETATHRFAIDPAAIDAVVRRGPLLLVQHHTDLEQRGDVLHTTWLDAPAHALLDEI